MGIHPEQRFTRRRPCPVCGGGHDDPQGRGVRCTGFLSEDGRWAHCTRDERAGKLQPKDLGSGPTYGHALDGRCPCGEAHDGAAVPLVTPKGAGDGARTFRAPVPDHAPPVPWEQKGARRPKAVYPWTDRQGRVLFYTVRFEWRDEETGDRKKTVTPRTCWERPDGTVTWEKQGPPSDWKRPLLNLADLAANPEAPVLVVEGEKAARAAAALFPDHIATTWHGGSKAVRFTDWTAIAGRDVVIWPDADEDGAKAAADVARACQAAGASRVRVVALQAELPKGWDLADPAPAGFDVGQALEAAPVWQAPTGEPAAAGAPEGAADESDGSMEGYSLDDEDLSEMGMAIRFARVHRGQVRYSRAQGWLIWDGERYISDDGRVQELVTTQILNLRREAAALRKEAGTLRAQAALLDTESHQAAKLYDRAKAADGRAAGLTKAAKELGRHAKIRGVMAQAESKPGIRCSPEEFDRDPWLLNVANGIIDLRTGEMRAHDPATLMTKLAGVAFEHGATSPTWERFIHDAFGGDPGLIRFVRQLIGYTLTGDTREQKFFILEGTGGNGKGVFLDTVIALMGDYARTVRKELATLAANGDSQAGDDLALLHTARLASVNELSAGDRLNVSRIKELTGGESIAARPLYRQAFNYQPAFKLFIRTNHLPEAKVDEALADRLVRVPFKVKFRGTDKDDKTLKARIMAELPGVLNWAIAGVRDWLEHGLVLPSAVTEANAEYVAEQDAVARFIAQYALRPVIEAGRLHEAYVAWCRAQGVQPISADALGKDLTSKGWGQGFGRTPSGKSVRVRTVPKHLLPQVDESPRQPVAGKIVTLPVFSDSATGATPFPPNLPRMGREDLYMGKVTGNHVAACGTRGNGSGGGFSPAEHPYEEGDL